MSETVCLDEIDRLRRAPVVMLWLQAARLRTLSLSQAPVLAGAGLAAQQVAISWRVVAATMAASAAIQVGTNLWNDAADARRGIDGADRLGPPRVVALGLLDEASVRRAAMLCFAVAALLGAGLAMRGGWTILGIGALALIAGYAYSAGPRPLSGTALGELLVVLFFGILAVTGTMQVLGAAPDGRGVAVGAVIGLPAAAILLLNNHRDRAADARGGRRTLAILLGPQGSRVGFAALLAAALLGAAALSPCGPALAALVPAAALSAQVARQVGERPVSAALNPLLARTALAQGLLVAGMVLGPLICALAR